ncbi:MAG: DNA alkylation repair protein [Thiotrichales bacterium]|nr:DNA alkylation repair protein [Thiotrichales bacterium]|tara:strand:- start:9 stop:713 length:705 start_codon:yes stop_codon:yes gene_type:complete
MLAKKIINELKILATEERKRTNEWFFKTEKGSYGYGDIFIGVTVPDIRKISKKFSSIISLSETKKLIQSPIHEVRLCALIILVNQYKKDNPDEIFDFYIQNISYINNWDLVDTSAPYITGDYFYRNTKKRNMMFEFSKSESLWIRRISIISTFYFIRNNEFSETLEIAKTLINDEQDLIHKAVGWMLREVYKRDEGLVKTFLRSNYDQLPRVMLRYAIEKMDKVERIQYLKGSF